MYDGGEHAADLYEGPWQQVHVFHELRLAGQHHRGNLTLLQNVCTWISLLFIIFLLLSDNKNYHSDLDSTFCNCVRQ